ncbi:MFS transporter, partial [Bordetella hinzii]|nr:MFS transporter [Bordetella hinzii]
VGFGGFGCGGGGWGGCPAPPHAAAGGGPGPPSGGGAPGGLQATTRVFGQSFGTALVAIAFSLSAAHGPSLGLMAAACCASLAIVVNSVRIARKIGQPGA